MIAAIAERAFVFGLVAAIGFGGGWLVNGWRLGEGIERDRADTVTVVRVIEREKQQVADTEGGKGHEELEQTRRDADAARSTAAGLRAEASRLATGLATCNAGIAGERQARERAAAVLADVLAGLESEGREMAGIAQRARASGLTCERTYNGVRSVSMK